MMGQQNISNFVVLMVHVYWQLFNSSIYQSSQWVFVKDMPYTYNHHSTQAPQSKQNCKFRKSSLCMLYTHTKFSVMYIHLHVGHVVIVNMDIYYYIQTSQKHVVCITAWTLITNMSTSHCKIVHVVECKLPIFINPSLPYMDTSALANGCMLSSCTYTN